MKTLKVKTAGNIYTDDYTMQNHEIMLNQDSGSFAKACSSRGNYQVLEFGNHQPRLDTAGVTSRGTKPAISAGKQQLDCKSGTERTPISVPNSVGNGPVESPFSLHKDQVDLEDEDLREEVISLPNIGTENQAQSS